MEKESFLIRCGSCGHSFRVRISGDVRPGRSYQVSCRCPRCGAECTETRRAPGKNGSGRDSLKYIVGIPLAVLLVVLVIAVIGGGTGGSSPLLRDLNRFRQQLTSYVGSGELLLFGTRILVLLVCFPVHESAHAWMADRLGDPTGRQQGRISLNPLRHLDLWGTVTIFLFGVGYAKPVPVRIDNFKHRKRDFALTALAGPLSNMLMAVLSLLILRFLPYGQGSREVMEVISEVLFYAAYINISLAVFNLIPIPPLDGSRVLTALLPDGAYDAVLRRERYMMVFLLLALILMSRLGYSPVGTLSGRVFRALYSLIAA